jgi:hypothetical protein
MSENNESASTNAHGTSWPMDDAASLSWWLEEGGWRILGRNANKWLGVIDYAALQVRGAATSAERVAFRDVALEAIVIGRNSGILPAGIAAEKEIHARMAYIRDPSCHISARQKEMTKVVEAFCASAPMSLGDAQREAQTWPTPSPAIIKSLRNVKSCLKLMEPGIEYLDDERQALLGRWLELLPILP